MNFYLSHLPRRPDKPRDNGITMMMDKGLSVNEAREFVNSSGDFTDFVKLGFGTALITKDLEAKLNVYRKGNIRPYFGGTLFEIFYIRGMFDQFRKLISKYKLDLVEVSDGTITMAHDEKLRCIETLAGEVQILSEVGSKLAGVNIPVEAWVSMMKTELQAGAWKVIAEARESGTIGIYNPDGSANIELISDITDNLQPHDVIWEAPLKSQQVYFIKMLGANVNLGNIAPNEVLAMEALRLGLRGDTIMDFLPVRPVEKGHHDAEILP
jgi:phosphosulfolactate synthase